MNEYHWIMTLQKPDGRGGVNVATVGGVTVVKPGETRMDVYRRLQEEAIANGWIAEGPNVMFFSLEPNKIGT